MGHGHCKNRKQSPTYVSWKMMVQRCTNKKRFDYINYGGNGIGVYFGWLGRGGFDEFLADVGERPSTEYHLSRINHEKDYEPGNVEWVLSKYNSANIRRETFSGKIVTVDGESKTLGEWSDYLGLKYHSLLMRLRRNWGMDAYRFKKGEKRCLVQQEELQKIS